MKGVYLASIGAIALIATVSLSNQIPGLASFGQPGTAIAQNIKTQPQIQLRLEAEKQVLTKDQQGKLIKKWQTLKGQVVVQPKDVLRYTLNVENISNRPIKNLHLNQPIPQGMVYVLNSTNTPKNTKTTYSIDGGRNFVENPTVKVTLPNGKVETQPAPASAYTHIRLSVPLLGAKTTIKTTYQTQIR